MINNTAELTEKVIHQKMLIIADYVKHNYPNGYINTDIFKLQTRIKGDKNNFLKAFDKLIKIGYLKRSRAYYYIKADKYPKCNNYK